MTKRNALFFSALLLVSAVSISAQVTGDEARAVFQRFRTMQGTWRSKSTKGWTETSSMDVIARGSVVIDRSHFDGEANDGMLTAIFLDGDQLLLTHYCEAKNQPTLIATKIDLGGRRVTFTFLRGTNMKTRDDGHMDSVIFDFGDDDHYKSRWSWFAKGKETWFEEIESERAPVTAVQSGVSWLTHH